MTQEKLNKQIAKLIAKLVRLDDKIGQMMSQRVEIEETLAPLYALRNEMRTK